MLSEHKTVPYVTNENGCCVLPQIGRRVQPVSAKNGMHFEHFSSNQSTEENEQRQTVEAHVFAKLEEYSIRKSIHLFHLSSLSHIRRRLRRDAKLLSRQFAPNFVSEQKILEWIDETLERIDSHLPQLRTLLESQDELLQSINTGDFSSPTNADNQWKELQLQRAKLVLSKITNNNDRELLTEYRKYILEKLTPTKIESDRFLLKNQEEKIDLNSEYTKAEDIGRQYLIKIFDDYKKRRYPNMKILKEMIDLGMNQMIKRPKLDDLRKATNSNNILVKANLILKSKRAYAMSLKNIADDFMLLRFGRVFNDQQNAKDSISTRFMSLIHMFLNTISLLVRSLRSDSSDLGASSPSFAPFNTELPAESILSPIDHVDQWTWLLEKWRITLQTLPIRLTRQGAFGRLVRTTIGVGIARLYGFAENDEQDGLDHKFFQALQMGFYYGVAYALVDGLQDDQQSEDSKQQIDIDKWLIDMEKILCGEKLDRSNLPQLPITSLLLETFDCLVHLTSVNNIAQQTFTDLALLLRSQRCDKKDLKTSHYDDVDLFMGSLMKAHFTYTATAFMGGARMVHSRERLWIMPFLGQLTDDCRDFNEDCRTQSFTPVTYFAQHTNCSSINPFFVFLFVSEDIYFQSQREKSTGAFLGRRIMRTLRAVQMDLPEFLKIFTLKSYPELYSYTFSLQNRFVDVSDPEKSIFRSVNKFGINYSFNHRRLETFAYDTLPLIEENLPITTEKQEENLNPLVRGMNHSLQAGGKRLRPLLLLMVAQLFHIEIKRVLPLARAIEYLHTSSLIFDDLPAQDNAPMRRGQPTLHMPIGDDDDIPPSLTEGRAQLAAVDLIAHAISLVTVGLREEDFSYESINRVTVELAQSMNELCYGQFLDLQSARMEKKSGKAPISLAELDHIAQLKTGKAIEVVLICPAILVDPSSMKISLDQLRELGRLLGILFQMKDDLLDVEGNTNELGKMANIDEQNQTMTYPRILGIEETRKRINQMRKQAENIVDELWSSQAGTIHDVIRHICERNK